MGYPDVQDGQARHVQAGTGVPGGPVPDEIPDTEQPGYGLPAAPGPGSGSRGGHRAAEAPNGASGPGTRTGAHRAAPDDRPGSRPASPGPGAEGRAGAPPAPGPGTDGRAGRR